MPLDTDKNRPIATTAHWGTYYAEVENGKLTGLQDYEKDPSPSIQKVLYLLDKEKPSATDEVCPIPPTI